MELPVSILFICTANSARSQIAEALITERGKGRFVAGSAGSQPGSRVNPLAVEALREAGIEWEGHVPKGIEAVEQEPWDIVITVCDDAKESCPIFPGQRVSAHWGLRDPAAVTGSHSDKLAAFRETLLELDRRLERLMATPIESLEPNELAQRLQAIADEGTSS